MKKLRLIARIDVKNEYVIKGIHLEGLRKIGDPIVIAKKYYEDGIDEIIFMDAVASLYDRNNLFHIIERACKEVFIPITIGGGIRSISDIEKALKSGADKITLNTGAIKNPDLIRDASRTYGSQCIIGSVEAKLKGMKWEAYIDNGRQETGIDAIDWIKKLQDLGAGEIFVTSIDREGTKKGFDIKLMEKVLNSVSIPVIASGGGGMLEHLTELYRKTHVDAIALASMLHYNVFTIGMIKQSLQTNNINIRV